MNYSPVTVLPALKNIFERLLSEQMYEFYYGLLYICVTSELVAVVIMDLSEALDVIQYPLLLSKLRV